MSLNTFQPPTPTFYIIPISPPIPVDDDSDNDDIMMKMIGMEIVKRLIITEMFMLLALMVFSGIYINGEDVHGIRVRLTTMITMLLLMMMMALMDMR